MDPLPLVFPGSYTLVSHWAHKPHAIRAESCKEWVIWSSWILWLGPWDSLSSSMRKYKQYKQSTGVILTTCTAQLMNMGVIWLRGQSQTTALTSFKLLSVLPERTWSSVSCSLLQGCSPKPTAIAADRPSHTEVQGKSLYRKSLNKMPQIPSNQCAN